MTQNDAARPRPDPVDLARRVSQIASIPPSSAAASEAIAAGPDAVLIASCKAAVAVAERKRTLFDGPGRIDDDAARDALLAPLDAEERPLLEAAARAVPVTWAGHVARAATFLLWDAGAVHNEAQLGSAGDRLLAAIVSDLATS